MNSSRQPDSAPPVALITGGSSGIGLASAIRLARRGYRLAICGRDGARLERAVKTICDRVDCPHPVDATPADLADPAAIIAWAEHVAQRWGRIDGLVNSAACATLHEMTHISRSDFELVVDTNIRGPFYLTQWIWNRMRRSNGGAIVNISSLAAVDPFPGFSLYGASKAWVETMSRALAEEGKPFGIRVFCVRPGAVETPMLRTLFPDFPAEQCVSADEVAAVIEQCITADPPAYPVGIPITVTNQQEPE